MASLSGQAPVLSQEDLRGELARFHSQPHRTLNTAFFGQSARGSVQVTVNHVDREFAVVPVACELELRRALVNAESQGTNIALLVDYAERLPLDIQGRLAGGRLQFISRERRLGNLFGVTRVAPTLVESPLADALLEARWPFRTVKAVTTVDLGTAWRRFLERAIGLPSEDALTEEGILDFFVSHPPSAVDPLLNKIVDTSPDFAAELEKFWASSVGPVANLAWRNWRSGRAADIAAMAFVLDAVMGSLEQGRVKVFLSMRLKEFGEAKTIASDGLLKRWAQLASALYLRLGDYVPAVLQRADALVDEPALRDVVRRSRFLAAGFHGRKAELAACLEAAVAGVNGEGEGVVSHADVARSIELYHEVELHRMAGTAANAAVMARMLMGVRLLAYLVGRPDWGSELKDLPPVEPLFRLAEAFAHEGGFVDLARKLVRGGHDSDPLEAALRRVAEAADAYRDQMDRRFAQALPLWNEDRRSGRVLAIEDALAELGVTFLQVGPQRRLLVLLMDGMSWASAVEIILDIGDIGYSPLRWQPPRAPRRVPMIAALPTMTEVSRAALFAGKLLQPGEQTSTMRDPERLLQHKAFVKAFGDGPPLLLRTDAESQTGHLTDAARKLVEGSERAVGVVVNAVDDQLTTKPGYQVHANRTTIKALEPLLTLAKDAGRAVLLIADHGHVTSTRPHTDVETGKVKAEKARYREVDADASVSDREVVVFGPNAFTERKGKRLALLYGETDRYVSQRHVGEHGGASLAEVVTPALLIGSQDLRALVAEEGEALDVVAYPVPAWWRLDVPVGKQSVSSVAGPKMPSKPGAKPKSPTAESQLVLSAFVPPTPPAPAVAPMPVPVAPTPSRWATRLGEIFADLEKGRKEQVVKRVVPAVELLVEHDGRLAEDVFAGALGQALRNVGGLVALMGEFLNEDGYQVIEHDAVGKQVRLDLNRLKELFGG